MSAVTDCDTIDSCRSVVGNDNGRVRVPTTVNDDSHLLTTLGIQLCTAQQASQSA